MKYTSALIVIVNAALVVLLGWGLAKFQARLLARRIPDIYQKLRPEKWILFMALASFWVGLVFLVSLILAQTSVRPVAPGDQVKLGIFSLLFFIMSARVFQSYFSLLGVSPEGLAWWTPGRGAKPAVEVAWADVAQVDASNLSSRFRIRARSGATFGNYFLGDHMPPLIDALAKHLPEDAMTPKAKTVFTALAQRLARYSHRR